MSNSNSVSHVNAQVMGRTEWCRDSGTQVEPCSERRLPEDILYANSGSSGNYAADQDQQQRIFAVSNLA